jgi:hypothetical protein
MRRAALGVALLLAGVAWLARYQYVGQGSTVMRVNRWTGTAAVLVRGRWRHVVEDATSERAPPPAAESVALVNRMRRIGDSLALDSARRAAADPYADIIGRRHSPDNPFVPRSTRHVADGYDSILQSRTPR